MMKSVLMSIKPKWCEKIASGEKTVEVRKTRPKIETPFKVYIYCTQEKRLLRKFNKGERIDDETFFDEHVFVRQNTWIRGHLNPNGKVIGEFVCDNIGYTGWFRTPSDPLWVDMFCEESCLTSKELYEYSKGKNFYEWHISDLVIYDKPKELSSFIVPSKTGCVNEGKCKGCIYLDRGNGYNVEDDCNAKFCTDEYKPLRRPPQSWCYVEEVNGNG